MLGTTTAILLCLLPSQVNALTALATCRSAYDWMFSSIGQSPCDVALELFQVCYSQPVQVLPLTGTILSYTGPYVGYDTSCLCNSVYYSLLSACAYCQGGSILPWSSHIFNCTSFYLAVYPYPIPLGVKVPAYAYQNVLVDNQFNVSLAYRVRGVESSRTLPSSTQTSTPTSSSSSSAAASSTSSRSGGNNTTTATVIANAPTISPGTVGGVVVGGLVGVGLIIALITFLVLRSKQKSRSQALQQTPSMAFNPDTAASLDHSGKVYDPNDESTYPSDMDDPYRQHSPPLNTFFTGNGSTQNHTTPQTLQQNNGGGYSGMPEL